MTNSFLRSIIGFHFLKHLFFSLYVKMENPKSEEEKIIEDIRTNKLKKNTK